MKKFSRFLMAFGALALVLTGCGDKKDEEKVTPEERVAAAITHVQTEYTAMKLSTTGVTASFDLISEHNGVKISYVSDDTAHVAVSADNKKANVTRPTFEEGDAIVKLTGTFKFESVEQNKDFGVLVLKANKVVATMSIAQFQAAASGDLVTVEGIVVARSEVSAQYNNFYAYIQNPTAGGFYAYRVPGENDAQFKVGNSVRVTGKKDNYNGLHQIAASDKATFEVEVLAENQTIPAYTNISEAISNVEGGDMSKVSPLFQSTLVELQGLVVTKVETPVESKDYTAVTAKLGNAEVALRVKYEMTASVALKDKFAAFEVGDVLTAKGVGDWYKVFQLTTLEVEKTGHHEVTDAEKVDMAMAAFDLTTKTTDADFTLPLTATNGVTVSWASNNAAITIDGANAKVTRSDADVEVTLTATFKLNEVSKAKDFKVTVVAMAATGEVVEVAHYDLSSVSGIYDGAAADRGIYLEGDITSLFTNQTADSTASLTSVIAASKGVEKAQTSQGHKVGGVKLNGKNGGAITLTLAEDVKVVKVELGVYSWSTKSGEEQFNLALNDLNKLYDGSADMMTISLNTSATNTIKLSSSVEGGLSNSRPVISYIKLFVAA